MLQDRKIEAHKTAAEREDAVAAQTRCEVSASIHKALAEMHRQEALRAASVQVAIRVAFGD